MLRKSKDRKLTKVFEKIRTDVKIGRLNHFTQLLFYKMVIEQDDNGGLPSNLDDFVSIVMPLSRKVGNIEFEKCLTDLEKENLITRTEDAIYIIEDYLPEIGHRRRESGIAKRHSIGLPFFTFDNQKDIERLSNELERVLRNVDDENELLRIATEKDKEWIAKGVDKSIWIPFFKDHLYLYYTNNITNNIKTIIYSSIIYNNLGLTKLQKVIEMYKVVKYPKIYEWKVEEHQEWNKANFARFVSTSKLLLGMCEDLKELIGIILVAPNYFSEKMEGIEWTLETVVKRFADIREYHNEKVKNMWIKSYTKEIQPSVEKEVKPLTQEEVDVRMKELREKLGLKEKEE